MLSDSLHPQEWDTFQGFHLTPMHCQTEFQTSIPWQMTEIMALNIFWQHVTFWKVRSSTSPCLYFCTVKFVICTVGILRPITWSITWAQSIILPDATVSTFVSFNSNCISLNRLINGNKRKQKAAHEMHTSTVVSKVCLFDVKLFTLIISMAVLSIDHVHQ